MNKAELIEKVASETGLTKADTERVSMSVNFDDRLDLEQALNQDGERGPKKK